jgi:hypothetical protein
MNNKKEQYTKKEFKIHLTWKQKALEMLLAGTTFGLLQYYFNSNVGLNNAIFQGISFGILFVLLFSWTMKKLVGKRIDNIVPELLDEEEIEEEIFANLFRGVEGVGGKIFLTNQRLIFKSHSLNIQKGQTNIEYSIISSVQKRKTAKLIDNGIKIITKQNTEYDFVVNDRDDVLDKIQNKLNS